MPSSKPKPKGDTTQARRQSKRRAEVDEAAARDAVMKDGRQATGNEAITLWKRGEYILIKKS